MLTWVAVSVRRPLLHKSRIPRQLSPHGWHTLGIGCVLHQDTKTVGWEQSWCRLYLEYHKALAPFFISSKVNNVDMVVSPLRRGPGNIHGFVLDGKSYRQE